MSDAMKRKLQIGNAAYTRAQQPQPAPAPAAPAPAAAPVAPKPAQPAAPQAPAQPAGGAIQRKVSQYDVARERVQQRENAALQQNKDAIARRAAQMGGGPSGAMIKLEQQAGDESAQRVAMENRGIDAAEAAEAERKAELEAGRQFAREERIGSQSFQSGESALQRRFLTGERQGSQEFAKGERLSSQDFARMEAQAGRKFTTSEREAIQKYQAEEAQKQRGHVTSERIFSQEFTADQAKLSRELQNSQFVKQMDLAFEQFAHEKFVDDFNMKLARDMFEEKDMLEKLMTGNPLDPESGANPALTQWQGVLGNVGHFNFGV